MFRLPWITLAVAFLLPHVISAQRLVLGNPLPVDRPVR